MKKPIPVAKKRDVDRSMLASILHDGRSCWKELAITEILYAVVAFVLLTPLVGILFELFVGMSGSTVLADADILFFFLHPLGWCALIVVGGVWIGTSALELTALMTIASGAMEKKRVRVRPALQFVVNHGWAVVRLTGRMVALSLLMLSPFLAAGGLVYATLLTEFDINYYLREKPPVFWVATVLIGVDALAMSAIFVRVLVGWSFSLPILLFESGDAAAVLRASRERTTGHRLTIALWIVAWILVGGALSALVTGVLSVLASVFIPHATGSLTLLVFSVGAFLIVWGAAEFVVSLVTTATFSILLVNLYRRLGSRERFQPRGFEAVETAGMGVAFRLSRRIVIGIVVLGVALAVIIGVVVLQRVRVEDHTEIMAHRGASDVAPENTLAAVKRAIADGADWVEVDVQETADGQVVVLHDRDLKKVGNVDLRIWEATAADLKEIDIGSWFAPEFKDERVPLLGDVLDLAKGKVRLNIELKYYGHDQRLEARVVELVESHGMESDIVVMSLNRDGVRKMKSLRPGWKVGQVVAVALGDLTRVDADFLAVSTRLATRGFIRTAHESDKKVYVWTVNDPVLMSTVMGRGADAIITDRPAVARSVLEQRARMSSAERLLVELAGLLGASPEAGSEDDRP